MGGERGREERGRREGEKDGGRRREEGRREEGKKKEGRRREEGEKKEASIIIIEININIFTTQPKPWRLCRRCQESSSTGQGLT